MSQIYATERPHVTGQQLIVVLNPIGLKSVCKSFQNSPNFSQEIQAYLRFRQIHSDCIRQNASDFPSQIFQSHQSTIQISENASSIAFHTVMSKFDRWRDFGQSCRRIFLRFRFCAEKDRHQFKLFYKKRTLLTHPQDFASPNTSFPPKSLR